MRVLKHPEKSYHSLVGLLQHESCRNLQRTGNLYSCIPLHLGCDLSSINSEQQRHNNMPQTSIFHNTTSASLEESLHRTWPCTLTSCQTTWNNINRNSSRKHRLDGCRRDPSTRNTNSKPLRRLGFSKSSQKLII